MMVLGRFRDVDDLDRFVWLRGFRDMSARAQGLGAFYGGPVWRRHRDVANATMVELGQRLAPPSGGAEDWIHATAAAPLAGRH